MKKARTASPASILSWSYEVQASNGVTTTKYYFFGELRAAMQRAGEAPTFLCSGYLNSTIMITQGISVTGQERYYAYGKDRHPSGTAPVFDDLHGVALKSGVITTAHPASGRTDQPSGFEQPGRIVQMMRTLAM